MASHIAYLALRKERQDQLQAITGAETVDAEVVLGAEEAGVGGAEVVGPRAKFRAVACCCCGSRLSAFDTMENKQKKVPLQLWRVPTA